MKNGKVLEGAYILWCWGDEDIDNPHRLREQLQDIVDHGFSLVFCELRATRYDLFSRQVVRTVTQVSQWAKSRQIQFWFNVDPRLASRVIIGKTGERIQYLIAHPKMKSLGTLPEDLIKKIKNNNLLLRYYYPRQKLTHAIPEVSLSFDPVALEKVFVFQMDGDQIIRETIRDVTSHVNFFVNIAKHYVEIYGKIKIPENETWWAIGFPKYNINLMDYISRENNDLMYKYIEDLFDEGAYIDGLFWQQPGYILDPWQYPVSEGIYNAFFIEYGYDIRKNLYGLALPVDDNSHLKIRHDYYTFINGSIKESSIDLSRTSKSFLGNIDFSISYDHSNHNCSLEHASFHLFNEWEGINSYSDTIGQLGQINNKQEWFQDILPQLVGIKSRSVFSNTQEAISIAWLEKQSKQNLKILSELLALFSIRLCAACYGYSGYIGEHDCNEPVFPEHSSWNTLKEINQKIHDIYSVTGFILPDANVAIIYPTETLKTVSPSDAKIIENHINSLSLYLTLNQIQIDIISPELLLEGKFTSKGFRIHHRNYEAILYPHPNIISEKILDLIPTFINKKFPFYFINSLPQSLVKGKKVSSEKIKRVSLIKDYAQLIAESKLLPIFYYPQNSLATMIRVMDGELFLIMPTLQEGKISGKIKYQSIEFDIETSDGLSIYSHWGGGDVQKVY